MHTNYPMAVGENASGIVLEGGGMRGIYVAGVLDVLSQAEIHFDGLVGVSAGAIHGVSFLSHQIGRSIRFYLTYSPQGKFMGWKSWLKTGNFINAEFCYDELPNKLVPFDHDTFEASTTTCYLTCTDLETGKPYYHLTKSIRGQEMDALRASASLPLVSKPVELCGHKLLDGGTADSIPIEFLRGLGYKKTVVVLTQVAGYRKAPATMLPFNFVYKKYPDFLESQRTRHERYNAALELIEKLEASGDIFVFRPSHKVEIKRLERNTERILEMYELGRQDATLRLEALKHFLAD